MVRASAEHLLRSYYSTSRYCHDRKQTRRAPGAGANRRPERLLPLRHLFEHLAGVDCGGDPLVPAFGVPSNRRAGVGGVSWGSLVPGRHRSVDPSSPAAGVVVDWSAALMSNRCSKQKTQFASSSLSRLVTGLSGGWGSTRHGRMG
ncbi:hypothetical protein DAI22_06g122100 [Oryza sativa Japonica Group]|nr:hypothetical protein DAI22_06g122100 [Oryza sativa Japonica Group]